MKKSSKIICLMSAVTAMGMVGMTIYSYAAPEQDDKNTSYAYETKAANEKNIESVLQYSEENEILPGMKVCTDSDGRFAVQIPEDATVYKGKHIDENAEFDTLRISNKLIDWMSITVSDKNPNNEEITSVDEAMAQWEQNGMNLCGTTVDFKTYTDDDGCYAGYEYTQVYDSGFGIIFRTYIRDDGTTANISAQCDNILGENGKEVNKWLNTFDWL